MKQQKSKLAVKHMMSFAAIAGLVLALAPTSQAGTIISLTGESATLTGASFVAANLINTLDTAFTTETTAPLDGSGTLLTYNPDLTANSSHPRQGQGTSASREWIAGVGGVWSATVGVIPGGEALAFLDVWGTQAGGGTTHFTRSRNLVITLTDSVNATSWSSSAWNGLIYDNGSVLPAIPGFGRFDFTGAGVTDNLLTLADGIEISGGDIAEGIQLNEIRLAASAIPEPSSPLAITSITSLGGGNWELTLKGENNTSYQFFSSPTLDFDTSDLVPLTVSGNPETDVTTDGSGNATVEAFLGDLGAVPANFVRAEGP